MLLSSGWSRCGYLRVSSYASASTSQITKQRWLESAVDCMEQSGSQSFITSQIAKQRCLVSDVDYMEQPGSQFSITMGYAGLIKECCNLKALAQGKRVHAQIVRSGLEVSSYLGNLMIHMYGKCGSLEDARSTFETMKERDVVSWTTMIAAYSQHGYGKQALDLFALMQRQGFRPNRITFLSILNACSDPLFIEDGKKIHAQIARDGLDSDIVVATALMNMYSKCQSLEDARKVFDRMPKRDAVSWTVIISAYAHSGLGRAALELFSQMRQEGVMPDSITLASILNTCAKLKALDEGKLIHKQILGSRLESDIDVANALINMYGKSGNVEESNRLFDQMPVRSLISWNLLMAAYSHDWNGRDILQLCGIMQWEGVEPDMVTCVSILDGCGSLGFLAEGMMIHRYVTKMGWERDVVLGTALMSMYSKCESLEEANKVFESLPDRDVVAWNAIIAAHAHHGQGKKSLQLFYSMQREGVKPDDFTLVSMLDACACPELLAEGKLIHTQIIENGLEADVIVGNALVNMYGKSGSVDCARRAFDNMKTRDIISWNAMIAVYAQLAYGREALQVFKEMGRAGFKPDNITYLSVLDACASVADQAEGKLIHASILNSGFPMDVSLENAILDMYGKCGNLEDAFDVFRAMRSRDSVSWNSLITTCAQHGRGSLALQAFGQMNWEGAKVDDLTIIGVLTGCNHAGQTEEGCHYFVSTDYRRNNSFIELFGCIADLLGRAK